MAACIPCASMLCLSQTLQSGRTAETGQGGKGGGHECEDEGKEDDKREG